MTNRNEPCPCNSGKKFKRCCMKNKAKGGSPFEKRQMMFRAEPKPTKLVVPVQALPQMLGFAAYGMMQRMRQERGGN